MNLKRFLLSLGLLGGIFAFVLMASAQSAQVPYPNRPTATLQLEAISNPETLPPLTTAERAKLADTFQVTLAETEVRPQILIERAIAQNQIVYISADEVEAYTRSILNRAEQGMVDTDLALRWGQLLETLLFRVHESEGPGRDQNLVYLTVAGKLLFPEFTVPTEVAQQVQTELDLIAVGGAFESPLSGDLRDYGTISAAPTPFLSAQAWLHTLALETSSTDPEIQAQLEMLQSILADPEIAKEWDTLVELVIFLQEGNATFNSGSRFGLMPAPVVPEPTRPIFFFAWVIDPSSSAVFYLEPDAARYGRLAGEVDALRLALGRAGTLTPPNEADLFELASLLYDLEAIAIRIDGSRPLQPGDQVVLSGYPAIWRDVQLLQETASPKLHVVLLEGRQYVVIGVEINDDT